MADAGIATDCVLDDERLDELLRGGIAQAVARQLADGHPIFYGGADDDSGIVFMQTPDGHRFRCKVTAEGQVRVLDEIQSR
ncbi:MAG TPA: hypothetical protein VFE42_19865 [Chloroflexota bacterium]|nr:hypothetical protein [Chloroflexota bacterium]